MRNQFNASLVVVDELHLYRGTAGSEVACLIKMFLNKIGLLPVIEEDGRKVRNPQLRILASSASLGDDQEFLKEFFGVYAGNKDGSDAFDVIGDSNSYYRPEACENKINYSSFANITPDFIFKTNNDKLDFLNEFATQSDNDCNDVSAFVNKYHRTIFHDFINFMSNKNDNLVKPLECKDFFGEGKMFPNKESFRGFLIFRGAVDNLKDEHDRPIKIEHRLPRFRFHQFFKYIEGLWAELQSTCNDSSPISTLSYLPQEVGLKGHKVLELLRCECCGELFIGGNRKVENSDPSNPTLTLNYPVLDTIPNFNPTPMVQNMAFSDYVLFWPKKLNQVVMREDHNEVIVDLLNGQGNDNEDYVSLLTAGKNDTTYQETHARAKWKSCYLNIDTGTIEDNASSDNIEGFLFELENVGRRNLMDQKKIRATPCCCPQCRQNYAKRIYAKSPIRSFRTGLEKSNQLLSKYLMYQLSDKANKLIGFSDSREDAAKQAYDIENEQYRDMVRMLFVESVRKIYSGVDDIKNFVNEQLAANINRNLIPAKASEKYFYVSNADVIASDVIDDKDVSHYKSSYVSLMNLIGSQNQLNGLLVRELVKLGINPAGVDYDMQFSDRGKTRHWSEAFDFTTGLIRENPDVNYEYFQTVQESLTAAVFENSFGKYMGVSTIDSGIGYICCPRTDAIRNSDEFRSLETKLGDTCDVYDFVDAYIRVLGDNYRYDNPDFNPNTVKNITCYGEASSALKKPIEKFSQLHNNIDEKKLGNALYNFLQSHISGVATKLDMSKLAFLISNSEGLYYECPRCHRVHLSKGYGFCTNTNCQEDLTIVDGKPISELRENHFISYDIFVEPKEPRRLHTEELTGQTDNIQERLLEFKDLILLNDAQRRAGFRKGYELAKTIDMMNVTTTMEVGVDIGSLEAIFQGNMPPTRFNYQQRVGRGGRRGQAFSAAFTFCRGRSHDAYYYFKATQKMIGSVPPPPTLSLAPFKDGKDQDGKDVYRMKLAIMKRVLVKDIFREALRGNYDYNLIDVAGQFGRVSEWVGTNRQVVADWFRNNSEIIDNTIKRYVEQYIEQYCDCPEIINDLKKLTFWIKNQLLSEIDQIVSQYPNKDAGLAQCMSENGYLPLYGLPSDLRVFYHGFNNDKKEVKTIERPLEMSISELAPGSEKTKDKGQYRVEGLTMPIKGINQRPYLTFINANNVDASKDALSDKYIVTFNCAINDQTNRNLIIDSVEPVGNGQTTIQVNNRLNNKQRLLIVPQAYRSYNISYNNGKITDNSERRSAYSQSYIFPIGNNGNNKNRTIKNVEMTPYGLELSDYSKIWHINTNNNRFYSGEYFRRLDPRSDRNDDDSLGNFMFYEEDGSGIGMGQNTINIAIGASKTTEMIELKVVNYNAHLDLNPSTGNRSAIRAAFYSAAFLIQRTLADKLDVSPDEIEISEKMNNNQPPIIYLSDALPNGAGLVSYLYQDNNLERILRDIVGFNTEYLESLIEDKHRQECLTSCQKCLKTYSNRGFHHVLDWRLGIGIINLMLDSNYDFGFTNDYKNVSHKELLDYDTILDVAARKLQLRRTIGECYWQMYPGTIRSRVVIIYHPMWKKEEVLSRINEAQNAQNVEMHNTFKLLRSDTTRDELPGRANDQAQPTVTYVVNTNSEVDNLPAENGNDDDFGIPSGHIL